MYIGRQKDVLELYFIFYTYSGWNLFVPKRYKLLLVCLIMFNAIWNLLAYETYFSRMNANFYVNQKWLTCKLSKILLQNCDACLFISPDTYNDTFPSNMYLKQILNSSRLSKSRTISREISTLKWPEKS